MAFSIFPAEPQPRRFLLYLNDGWWAGKQVIPSEWVKESTKRWSEGWHGLGYGYMWWELPSTLGLGGSPQSALWWPRQRIDTIVSSNFALPTLSSYCGL
jgi:CubicO group peptidase (beta-lactamase class C family)